MRSHFPSSGTNFGGLFCTNLLSPMSFVCRARAGSAHFGLARRSQYVLRPAHIRMAADGAADQQADEPLLVHVDGVHVDGLRRSWRWSGF